MFLQKCCLFALSPSDPEFIELSPLFDVIISFIFFRPVCVRIEIANKHLEPLRNTSEYVLDNEKLIIAIEDINKKPVDVKVRDRTSE